MAFILQRRSVALSRRILHLSGSNVSTTAAIGHDVCPLGSPKALEIVQREVRGFSTYSENAAAKELYNRHRTIMALNHKVPDVAVDAWIAPNATLIGDVIVEDRSVVWYSAVLRGDMNSIRVGPYSNIGEKTVVHAAETSPTGLSAETIIGKYVTIGSNCSLRSCNIDDEVVIGHRCVVMEGSIVEKHAVLGDGSIVPPGRRIPGGELWSGSPARFVRRLSGDETAEIVKLAEGVSTLADEHAGEFLPYTTAYIEAEKLKKALVLSS